MAKYYCDFCNTYIAYDSHSVREAHFASKKHRDNVNFYYQKLMEEQAQYLIDARTAAFKANKNAQNSFGSLLPPPAMGPRDQMAPPMKLGRYGPIPPRPMLNLMEMRLPVPTPGVPPPGLLPPPAVGSREPMVPPMKIGRYGPIPPRPTLTGMRLPVPTPSVPPGLLPPPAMGPKEPMAPPMKMKCYGPIPPRPMLNLMGMRLPIM